MLAGGAIWKTCWLGRRDRAVAGKGRCGGVVAGRVAGWEAHRGSKIGEAKRESKIGKKIGKQERRLFQKIAAI